MPFLFQHNWTSCPDATLMKGVASGHDGAFNAVYQRYYPRLFRFVKRSLDPSSAEVDDLLQECFLRLVKSADRFDPNRSLETFLFTILRNLLKNEYRRLSRIPEMTADLPLETIATFDHSFLETNDEKHAVTQALNVLEPTLRMIMILRFQEELSVREIALIMECPEGTIKSRIYYGLKKLETVLHKTLNYGIG